ncbi:MAG: DUF2490 domain-containing protein [Gemmatimonadota bacterium]
MSLRSVAAWLLLSATVAPLEAQTSRSNPTDLQAWYSTDVEVELTRRWELSLQYRFRMVDGASRYRGSYFYGTMQYELISWLDAVGDYRLGLVEEEAVGHRFGLGAQATYDVGDLRLYARAKVQHRSRSELEDNEYVTDERTLVRTRFRARHPLSRNVDLLLSTEPYFTFEGEERLDNIRNQVELRWEYSQRKRLDLFYIYRPNFRKNYDRTFHVVGVGLHFEVRPFR